MLAGLGPGYDQVYHLATFHGNQNSIAEPLLDHENNLLTTIKLFERLRELTVDGRVVYSASGCSLAEKTDEDPTAVTEDGPVPLDHDSPYQISKVVGEFYCVWYHSHFGLPTVRARFQNVYGPGETLGAGVWRGTSATVWRNVVPTFVYRALKGLPLRLDNAGPGQPRLHLRRRHRRGPAALRLAGRAGRRLQPGGRRRDDDPRAGGDDPAADRTRTPSSSSRRAGRGTTPGAASAAPPRRARRSASRPPCRLEEGLRRTVEWTRENLDRIDACVERHAARLATA